MDTATMLGHIIRVLERIEEHVVLEHIEEHAEHGHHEAALEAIRSLRDVLERGVVAERFPEMQ